MPRDNSSKRMFADNQNKYDALMWERRYNTCVEGKQSLYQDLDECVDMLNRVLLHVDLDDVNPPLKKQIQELLNKIQ
jgi:hypothetical protein